MASAPNGKKLTYQQAMTWTNLFALEDTHILVKHILEKKNYEIKDISKWNKFKTDVALQMYLAATGNPTADLLPMIDNCLELMGEEALKSDESIQTTVLNYHEQATLKHYYNVFIKYFNQLDEEIHKKYNKPLSKMTIAGISNLPLREFGLLDVPFRIIDNLDDINEKYDHLWHGLLEYDQRRDLYVISQIIPPSGNNC